MRLDTSSGSITIPVNAYVELGLMAACVVLGCLLIGMVVAMRYERRVR